MPDFATHAYAYIVVGFLLVFLVFWPLWGIVIGRHYDKLFPDYVADKYLFENQHWIASVCLRGAVYAGCMIFYNYPTKSVRKEILNYYFKGYNFRQNARWQDWLVIGIEFGCLGGILVTGIVSYLITGVAA
jgi:hypothetical protein